MSWQASRYVRELVDCPNGEKITRSEKLVAFTLADQEQKATFPSVANIAKDCLMDERSCRRILNSLEAKGVIERTYPKVQYRGVTTFYRFPAHKQTSKRKEDTETPLFPPENEVETSPIKEDSATPLEFPATKVINDRRGTEGGQKGDKTPHPLNNPLLGRKSKEEQLQEQVPVSTADGTIPPKKTRKRTPKHTPDPRHTPFRSVLERYWENFNTFPLPWDVKEADNLSDFLKASPTLDVDTFRLMLWNRCRSEGVNHSELPKKFLGNLVKYSRSPLDQYGKPKGTVNSNGNGVNTKTTQSALDAISGYFSAQGLEPPTANLNGDQSPDVDSPSGNGPSDPRAIQPSFGEVFARTVEGRVQPSRAISRIVAFRSKTGQPDH